MVAWYLGYLVVKSVVSLRLNTKEKNISYPRFLLYITTSKSLIRPNHLGITVCIRALPKTTPKVLTNLPLISSLSLYKSKDSDFGDHSIHSRETLLVVSTKMGRVFIVDLEGQIYSCKHCNTHLTKEQDIMSKVWSLQSPWSSFGFTLIYKWYFHLG